MAWHNSSNSSGRDGPVRDAPILEIGVEPTKVRAHLGRTLLMLLGVYLVLAGAGFGLGWL